MKSITWDSRCDAARRNSTAVGRAQFIGTAVAVRAEAHVTTLNVDALAAFTTAAPHRSKQQLSRLVGVDPRDTVPPTDLLEERGLIDRAHDPDDRRLYAVSVTIIGRSALTELRHAADEVEVEMLKQLDATERGSLHNTLVELFAALAEDD